MQHNDFSRLFSYLALADPLPDRADLIIGFGHFDFSIPAHCVELYRSGLAPKILFTGGVGAGSADLSMPEGQAFAQHALELEPTLPSGALIVEDRSTNTAENILFSQDVLAGLDPPLRFAREIRSVICVASPYRQRRVDATLELLLPGVRRFNAPPQSDYNGEKRVFLAKGERLDALLAGELQRLDSYPARGFIAPVTIPPPLRNRFLT